MAVLIIVDSLRRDAALKQAVQPEGEHRVLSLDLSSRELTAVDYRVDTKRLPSLSFADLNAEEFERIYIVSAADAAGDALARRAAESLGPTNRRLQRLVHDKGAGLPAGKAVYADSAWRRGAAWETCVEVDRRIDAVLRRFLPSAPPAVAGLSVLAALALILERQAPREKVGETKPKVKLVFSNGKAELTAVLRTVNGKEPSLPHPEYFKALVFDLRQQSFTVESIAEEEAEVPPEPPFHLGSLAAAAEESLGWSVEQTLSTALSLYETTDDRGQSVITYPITDSDQIPEDEALLWRAYIFTNYGKEYVPPQPRQGDGRRNHLGAVRPVSPRLTPKALRGRLSEEQHQLYSLIWQQTIASQMTDQCRKQKKALIVGGENCRYTAEAQSREVVRRGFAVAFPLLRDAEIRAIKGEIRPKAKVKLTTVELEQKIPIRGRYGFGKLAEELISRRLCFPEQLWILPQVLEAWQFTEQQAGLLQLSDVGRMLVNKIQSCCPRLLHLSFLERLQEKIAASSRSDGSWERVLTEIDKLLDGFKTVNEEGKAEKQAVTASVFYGYCPECAGELTLRSGRFGRFIACSAFPKCRYTRPLGIGVKCPADGCRGEVIERIGKGGDPFYGCSEFPVCRFMSRNKPVNSACPKCGSAYLIFLSNEKYKCPRCKAEFDEMTVR